MLTDMKQGEGKPDAVKNNRSLYKEATGPSGINVYFAIDFPTNKIIKRFKNKKDAYKRAWARIDQAVERGVKHMTTQEFEKEGKGADKELHALKVQSHQVRIPCYWLEEHSDLVLLDIFLKKGKKWPPGTHDKYETDIHNDKVDNLDQT